MKITHLSVLLLIALTSGNHFINAQPNSRQKVVLLNAYDAFGVDNKNLKQDFGFSCVVEYNGQTILFDAGTDSKIFQQNIKTLKVDPKTIDVAILSHGHYDHMGGLDYLLSVNPDVKIYLPNDFFSLGAPVKFPFKETEPSIAKTLPADEQYFRGEKVVEGMVTVPTGRFWKGNVEYVTAGREILPGVHLVPTVSSLMGTFIKYPPFENNPQYIGMPELSVTFSTSDGQIILAGCSHSTIETIIQETIKLNADKILLVTGGFHLIPYSREYIEGLASRMKEVYHVESVAPAHCTGHMGFSIFKNVFGDHYKVFGLGKKLEL